MTKKSIYARMKELYPFINNLSDTAEKLLISKMTIKTYPPKFILVKESFNCDTIFFVLKGSFRVFKLSDEGREITLYRIIEGDLCLMTTFCLLTDNQFPGIIQVEDRKVEVAALPAEPFKRLVNESQHFQTFLLESSLNRLKDVVDVVENLSFTSVKQRLAKFLITSANKQLSYTLRLTHEEIALEIGTAREVISRNLKELESEGIVNLYRGRIEIVSLSSLEKICLCD